MKKYIKLTERTERILSLENKSLLLNKGNSNRLRANKLKRVIETMQNTSPIMKNNTETPNKI